MENSPSGSSESRAQVAALHINKNIYRVYEGVNTVGCHTNAIISINDENIDIHHAIIICREGEHFISDLRSSEGTYIDCTKLVPFKLYELDISGTDLRFGELLATFKSPQTSGSENDAVELQEAPTQDNQDFHEASTQIINWEQLPTISSDLSKSIPPPPPFHTSDLDDFNDEHLPLLDCDQNLVSEPSRPDASPKLNIFEEATEVLPLDDADVDVTDVTGDNLPVKTRSSSLDCGNGDSNESLELLNYDKASTCFETSKNDNSLVKSVLKKIEGADSGSDTEEELEALLNEQPDNNAKVDDGSDTDVEVEGLTNVTADNKIEDSFQRPSVSFIDKSIPATQYAAEGMDDSDIIPATQYQEVKPRESEEKEASNTENSFKLGLTQMMYEEDADIFDAVTQRVGAQLNASLHLIDDTFSALTQKVSNMAVRKNVSVIPDKEASRIDDSDVLDSTFSPGAFTSREALETIKQCIKRNESRSGNRSQTGLTMELLKDGPEKEVAQQSGNVVCKEHDKEADKVEPLENVENAGENGFRPEDINQAAGKTAEISQIVEKVSSSATSLIRRQPGIVDLAGDVEKRSGKLDSNDGSAKEKSRFSYSPPGSDQCDTKRMAKENGKENAKKSSDIPENMEDLTDIPEKTDNIIQEPETIEGQLPTADKKRKAKRFVWKKRSQKAVGSSSDELASSEKSDASNKDEEERNMPDKDVENESTNSVDSAKACNKSYVKDQEPEIVEKRVPRSSIKTTTDSDTIEEKHQSSKRIREVNQGRQASATSNVATNAVQTTNASNKDNDTIQKNDKNAMEKQLLTVIKSTDLKPVETPNKADERVEEREQEPELVERRVPRGRGRIKSTDSDVVDERQPRSKRINETKLVGQALDRSTHELTIAEAANKDDDTIQEIKSAESGERQPLNKGSTDHADMIQERVQEPELVARRDRIKSNDSEVADEKQKATKRTKGKKLGRQASESPDEARNRNNLTIAEKAEAFNKDDDTIREIESTDSVKCQPVKGGSIDSAFMIQDNVEESGVVERRVQRGRGRIKSANSEVVDEKQQGSKRSKGRKLGRQASESPYEARNTNKLTKAEASNKDDGAIREIKSADSIERLQLKEGPTHCADVMQERVREPEIIEKQVPRRRGRIKYTDSEATDGKQRIVKKIKDKTLGPALDRPHVPRNAKELAKVDAPYKDDESDKNSMKIEDQKNQLTRRSARRKSTDSDPTRSKGKAESLEEALGERHDIDVIKEPESLNEENETALDKEDWLQVDKNIVEKTETKKRGLRLRQASESSEASVELVKEYAPFKKCNIQIRRLRSEISPAESKPVGKRVRINAPSSEASQRSTGKGGKITRKAVKVKQEDVKQEIKKDVDQKALSGKRGLKRGRRLGSNGSEGRAESGNNDKGVTGESANAGDEFKPPRQTPSARKIDPTSNNTRPKRQKLDNVEPEKPEMLKSDAENDAEVKRPQKGRKPKQETGDGDTEASTSQPSLNSISPARSECSLDSLKGKRAKRGVQPVTDSPQRGSRRRKHKVVFTLMENPQLESQIRQLGGTMGDSVNACTVLVTGSVKRTPKLLSAVGLGKPICSPEWIAESKKAHEFLDPWDHILTDPEAEEKWDFSLKESLNRSKRRKILNDYTFLNQCQEKAEPLKAAIESCGGKYLTKMPATPTEKTFIISPLDNKPKLGRILKNNPQVKVIEPEAIVDGVLRQELRFHRHLIN